MKAWETPLPPMAMKPNEKETAERYSHFVRELNAVLSFRSLDLSGDLDTLHDWVNQAYARRFWQLNGSKALLKSTYEVILQNPRAHSFIGCLDGVPVGQVDVYGIMGEELQQHVTASPADCGVHLLMLPTRQLKKGWSYYTLKNFQRYYFSFAGHEQLFAEPDRDNVLANKLARDAGFRFLKTIELSNKTANLYRLCRQDFRPV